ncbi:MAG: hypothetical protein OEP52_03685 [Acidimicrobiia bacterium]|nr:hypothetical protein [Acidimicrobiia bacterium]
MEKRREILLGLAVALTVMVASCDSGAGGDPDRLCEIVAKYSEGRARAGTNVFSHEQVETDWEVAVAAAPPEARAAAKRSLAVAREARVLASGEEPPDEAAWTALVDRGTAALGELQEWRTAHCEPR